MLNTQYLSLPCPVPSNSILLISLLRVFSFSISILNSIYFSIFLHTQTLYYYYLTSYYSLVNQALITGAVAIRMLSTKTTHLSVQPSNWPSTSNHRDRRSFRVGDSAGEVAIYRGTLPSIRSWDDTTSTPPQFGLYLHHKHSNHLWSFVFWSICPSPTMFTDIQSVNRLTHHPPSSWASLFLAHQEWALAYAIGCWCIFQINRVSSSNDTRPNPNITNYSAMLVSWITCQRERASYKGPSISRTYQFNLATSNDTNNCNNNWRLNISVFITAALSSSLSECIMKLKLKLKSLLTSCNFTLLFQ